MLPKRGRILDIGCGYGRDSVYFSEKGFDTTGIDTSVKLLSIAKRLAPGARFYKMDMKTLKFKAGYFDGIWCWASFYHLNREDGVKALKEMHRVLRKGGTAVFLTRRGSGEGLVTDKRYTPPLKKFVCNFRPSEFEKLLKAAGFKIIKVTSVVHQDKKYCKTPTKWILAFAKKVTIRRAPAG